MRIAVAQQRAETRIVFDQHETLLIDAVLDQRAGDCTGTGAKLDDRLRGIDIDILRHGARQHASRWHDGAHVKRLFDP